MPLQQLDVCHFRFGSFGIKVPFLCFLRRPHAIVLESIGSYHPSSRLQHLEPFQKGPRTARRQLLGSTAVAFNEWLHGLLPERQDCKLRKEGIK